MTPFLRQAFALITQRPSGVVCIPKGRDFGVQFQPASLPSPALLQGHRIQPRTTLPPIGGQGQGGMTAVRSQPSAFSAHPWDP